jgi:hypothetical protein
VPIPTVDFFNIVAHKTEKAEVNTIVPDLIKPDLLMFAFSYSPIPQLD